MRLKLHHLSLAFAALLSFPLAAAETTEKAPVKTTAPAGEAAMKIHVDPATGQVVVPRSDPGARTAATSAQALPPLKVEKVTAKAGGKKVNLQGRFVMEMAATVGSDGKVTQSCDQKPEAAPNPAGPEKEPRHDR